MKSDGTIVGVGTAKRTFQVYCVNMETVEVMSLKSPQTKFLVHVWRS